MVDLKPTHTERKLSLVLFFDFLWLSLPFSLALNRPLYWSKANVKAIFFFDIVAAQCEH